jgi:uncharacterized membrane protein YbhN (UPF0104 family)
MNWKLFKYALILFAVITIAIAFLSLHNISKEITINNVNFMYLFVSVICQILSFIIVAFSWKINLRLNSVAELSLKESIYHIGLNGLGKYSPGKIVGSIFRGLTIYKRYGNRTGIFFATLIEQIAMIQSGVILYGLIYMYYQTKKYNCIYVLIGGGLSISIVPFVFKTILRFSKRFNKDEHKIQFEFNSWRYIGGYCLVFIFLSTVWVTTSLSLFYVSKGIGANTGLYICAIATLAGYLTGFAAVFLPAGIGAREGVIVAILSTVTSVKLATTIALIVRLIAISIDIMMGIISIKISTVYEK